ncbi:MAG: hypothetical protein A3H69_04760 [Candidatus Sungbacteria bacterium RIFCSPLOWO2_02_FULL_47_9]|nr:MAG: hypothetical protein UX72_C0010G0021 [Parcubacteria group bacterium GW2011_GWA2_47_10]OGZ97958.1 MAG: hypothetical protein A3D57_05035 [Candidatus Sungbacteria bacterium RIFCSPHIGHO2_02_FULL_46_12]OHA04402.1 MAG: hypothetical protein A3A28_03715 [Candidatus Sungbacteria bacterium RIFCSPLOWO2_01_FULL_47_32]OHA11905.1 MAG: hypothetical protein A3H69_04760 [Candidatus Sungbacteria bacterium RIFCSPLOWO2_02_FULL_47_9]
MDTNVTKPIFLGVFASIVMLGAYFAILTLVSGWNFAQFQFLAFRYFIVSLAVGFGVQVGLYAYLKNIIRSGQGNGKILGVTGTTSTAAMISCCAHYLTNVLPVLGAVGIITFVAQYQIQFFWIGLAFNLGGIVFMFRKIIESNKQQ